MNTLKLAVGKRYLNTLGVIVTINGTGLSGLGGTYFLGTKDDGHSTLTYGEDGTVPGNWDEHLVAQWNGQPLNDKVLNNPHAATRLSFAQGAKIEWRGAWPQRWGPIERPVFFPEYEYRISAKGKQETPTTPEPTRSAGLTPRPHAEVIKAWADGAEVEFRAEGEPDWETPPHPCFYEDHEYRVKRPTKVVWIPVISEQRAGPVWLGPDAHNRELAAERQYSGPCVGALRLELNPDNGDVISCVREDV